MSKATDGFKKSIRDHLERRAFRDPLFRARLKREDKSLEECIKYIFGQVQKSGRNGFQDDEIYDMAVHYYDEDNIKVGDYKGNAKVVHNGRELLSPDEIEELKKNAREQVIAEEKKKMRTKPDKGKVRVIGKEPDGSPSPTLFGDES